MILRLVLFFVYGLQLPKRNTNLLYNNIGDMNIMHQICCILIGSFMVYVCIYVFHFMWASVCVRVYACVYIAV